LESVKVKPLEKVMHTGTTMFRLVIHNCCMRAKCIRSCKEVLAFHTFAFMAWNVTITAW
jgi:hypothetical protein